MITQGMGYTPAFYATPAGTETPHTQEQPVQVDSVTYASTPTVPVNVEGVTYG